MALAQTITFDPKFNHGKGESPFAILKDDVPALLKRYGFDEKGPIHLLFSKLQPADLRGRSDDDLKQLIADKKVVCRLMVGGAQRVYFVGQNYTLEGAIVQRLRQRFSGLVISHGLTSDGTDAALNLDGYISVTPMRADLTAHDMLEAFKGIE